MAQGKTQQIIYDTSSNDIKLCVNIEETYDVSSNTSEVYIPSIQVMTTGFKDTYYPTGYITINGTTLNPTMSVGLGSHHLAMYYSSFSDDSAIINSNTNAIQTYRLTGIKHNDDGSLNIRIGVEISFSPYITSNRWSVSGTKTIALTNIPRTSDITSIGNVTLGEACDIAWTPSASSFGYKVKFSLGSWSYTTGAIRPNQTNAYTYSGYVIPIEVANQITTATSGTMTATLYTYSDSNCRTLVGSTTGTFVVYVPEYVIPVLESLDTSIDNSSNSTLQEWGVAVAGYTKVNISAAAKGSYGSTISSFTISGGYNITQTGNKLSYTGGVITSSGSQTFTVYATDSRGRSSELFVSSPIMFYSYSNPKVTNFIVSRSSSDNTQMSAKATWSYSDIDGKNASFANLYYKEANSSSWNEPIPINNNVEMVLGVIFDETISYTFMLEVVDLLNNITRQEGFTSTIKVLMDFRAGGNGLGIGKIAESDSLEIALDTIFFGNVYIKNLDGENILLEDYIRNIINNS